MSALTGPKGESTDHNDPDDSQPKAITPNELPSDGIELSPATNLQNQKLNPKVNSSTNDTLAQPAEHPEESELTTADKDALKGVIDEIFETRSNNNANCTKSASTGEGRRDLGISTRKADQEQQPQKHENELRSNISEEYEEPSGEATEPLNEKDLAWIFEDSGE